MGLLSPWLGNRPSAAPGSSLALVPSLALTLPGGVGGRYFWGYTAFSSALHLFEQYLELRQLQKNRETRAPDEVKALGVEEKDFLEAQAYQKDKRLFSMVRSWVGFAFSKVCLALVNPAAWRLSARLCGAENENRTTLLWLLLLQWVEKPLELGFGLYRNFVIEEKHGFNKMTYGLFFSDLVKSELLTYAFAGPLIPGLCWLVRRGGQRFYLYTWGALQGLMFAFMWVYPNFIQPLFNKFEPLKDEELRGKIENLAVEEEFPLAKLFQVDGSKRSSHSNAYFFGFWKNKRIVIYDTLLTLNHDQVLAVLCHELGHWKFGHTTANIAISSAHIFALFWLFGQVMYSGRSKDLVRSFGYGETNAVMISLMTYSMLIEPAEQVIQLAMTVRSRANEFQADAFAVAKGRGEELATGLLKMDRENKGDLNPDPLYAWYHFSHPALVERLRALRAAGKKGQ
mmetsp:Transcript_3067/g.10205  ORF Transcript_3067/g.10205 Transcript_3067/m.10205 type:complete len:455 (+) Transcript_3067:206-1570(+)